MSEDTLEKTIFDRIHVATKFSEKWHDAVKRNNKLWTGELRPRNIPADEKVNPNYTYAIIKNKIARLYYRNPDIDVRPVNGRDESMLGGLSLGEKLENAKNAELVINYQKDQKELKLRPQIQLALYDWKRARVGAIFTGWKTLLEQRGDTVTSILNDRPDIRRVSPLKIHFPPGFDRDNIPYIVLEFEEPLKKVKQNTRYSQARDEVKATHFLSKDYRDSDSKTRPSVGTTDDMARVVIYHYYDEENWLVFAKDLDKPLLRETNPYGGIFGPENPLPVVFIWGDDDLEDPFGLSDVDVIKDQQLELNKIRYQQINHRKRFNRRGLYDKDILSEESDVEKLKSGQDGVLVGVSLEGNKALSDVVYNIPEANITYPERVEEHVKEDINVISGMVQTGLSGRSTNSTLGQDQIAEERSQDRLEEEQVQVEEFVEKVYERLLQLNQAFLQTAIAVKVSGDGENQQWAELTGDDIAGSMSLKVVSSSTVRETDLAVRKEAQDVLSIISGIPIFMHLIPEIVSVILDTYPMFSAVADQAKILAEEAKQNPELLLPPEPGPSQGRRGEAAPTEQSVRQAAENVPQ